MSELHTEDNAPEVIEDQAIDTGTVENGPDLATGEGENPDINQDAVKKRIDRATHLTHKAERAEKAAKQESKALQDKLDAIEASKPAPTISDIPDREYMSDEEYSTATAKRDDEVRADAAYRRAADTRNAAAVQRQNDAYAETNRVRNETIKSYGNRAKELKVTDEQLNTAASVVVDYGMSVEVADFILSDPNGPLITQYLSKNISELSALTQMSPMQAAVMISQTISPKFASTKPVNSQAPDPLRPVRGSGAAPKKRGATGTTFE